MKHVCKHPERQGKHVREVVDYLRAIGAEAIRILRNKTVQLVWRFGGREFRVSVAGSSHPGRHARDLAAQAIRRKLHGAGFAVPAHA